MNFFSTDAFLETAEDVFHPNQERRLEPFLVQGQHLRMLSVGRHRRPMLSCPFMDFVQPIAESSQDRVREWPWVPRTVPQERFERGATWVGECPTLEKSLELSCRGGNNPFRSPIFSTAR